MINNAHHRRTRFLSLANTLRNRATGLANVCNDSQVATVAISSDDPPIIRPFGVPSAPQVLNRYGYVRRENEPMHMVEDALAKLNPAETNEATLFNIENRTTLFIDSITEENDRRNNNN